MESTESDVESQSTQRASDAQVKDQKAKAKSQNAPKAAIKKNLTTSGQRRESETSSRKRRCCMIVVQSYRDDAVDFRLCSKVIGVQSVAVCGAF